MKRSILNAVQLGFLLFTFAFAHQAGAGELSGYISSEARAFANDAVHSGQERNNVSIAGETELYHEWENGSSFTFTPFVRYDSADSKRSHFDIRELNMLWLNDSWELRIGIGKVFWGGAEFVHLVDIINQTDYVESIDGEEKLGQPMVHLSVPKNWGVIDMFVLPGFRERTFPGIEGRLRPGLVVDTDNAVYESSDKERHIDFALRYSHSIGNVDFGIYNFNGTGRDPSLSIGFNGKNEMALIPYYPQINQTGLDMQVVAGEWLYKLEAIYRSGQGDSYFAGVGGVEYSFFGIGGSGYDLGIFGQWAYDDRGDSAMTAYENDAILGTRFSFNDQSGSELVTGLIQDIDTPARAGIIRGSRRFGSQWKVSLESWIFLDSPEDDLFYSIRDDDFIKFEIGYYY